MHWFGEQAKAYILYKLGFEARVLLGSKSVPSIIELNANLKKQSDDTTNTIIISKQPKSNKKLNALKRELEREKREKLEKKEL